MSPVKFTVLSQSISYGGEKQSREIDIGLPPRMLLQVRVVVGSNRLFVSHWHFSRVVKTATKQSFESVLIQEAISVLSMVSETTSSTEKATSLLVVLLAS